MAKAKAKPVALPALPLDPFEADAQELFQLDQWRKSPEVAGKMRRHEELRQRLKGPFKDGQRNAPWQGSGWRVYYVQQRGKAKSVCAIAACGNMGLHHSPEWHLKAEVMVNSDAA